MQVKIDKGLSFIMVRSKENLTLFVYGNKTMFGIADSEKLIAENKGNKLSAIRYSLFAVPEIYFPF